MLAARMMAIVQLAEAASIPGQSPKISKFGPQIRFIARPSFSTQVGENLAYKDKPGISTPTDFFYANHQYFTSQVKKEGN